MKANSPKQRCPAQRLLFSFQTQFSVAPPQSILAPKCPPHFLDDRIATGNVLHFPFWGLSLCIVFFL